MNTMQIHDVKYDSQFQKPFVDAEEWRDEPLRHLYIHGGFEGTKVRFALYFPPKERYQGRFFQYVTPIQGSENACEGVKGENDEIGFALSHGAYFVHSNMGGDDPDFTMIYRSSAAVAEYSREVAKRSFGGERPFGYIYGGSGGGYKTMGCVERTEGVWDGSVPFVIGSPMSIPNMFTVRVHAMRLLRNKLPQIVDAVDPGGSGDMYANLNEEERAALEEVTRMGFPPRAWFSHDQIGDGSLPRLIYSVNKMDPEYYTDFWTKPGYLGYDENGSAMRDRFRFETKVATVELPEKGYNSGDNIGQETAWESMAYRYETEPTLVLESAPDVPEYLEGTKICVTSGQAAGLKLPLGKISGNRVSVGTAYGMGDVAAILRQVKPGDGVMLDNSDYIAIQTYHRHQVPDNGEYCGWDQFRDENGEPIYPQRPVNVSPAVTYSAVGSTQSGRFRGKMIVVACLLDESALPWQPDWYRQKVRENGGEENFRLWYNDNAMHWYWFDHTYNTRIVNFRGALSQALLDVSAWVEKGIAPPESTSYTIADAQVNLPDTAGNRKGVQPLVALKANGGIKTVIKIGEAVEFEGFIEAPPGTGKITRAEFDFEGAADYTHNAILELLNDDGSAARVRTVHVFNRPGTYFPALRASSNRHGDAEDIYTQVKNLARVRVIVQ